MPRAIPTLRVNTSSFFILWGLDHTLAFPDPEACCIASTALPKFFLVAWNSSSFSAAAFNFLAHFGYFELSAEDLVLLLVPEAPLASSDGALSSRPQTLGGSCNLVDGSSALCRRKSHLTPLISLLKACSPCELHPAIQDSWADLTLK